MPSSLAATWAPILKRADVRLDGSRPWDIAVRDDRLFARVTAQGSLGFGEAYMDGWWECEQIDELIARLLRANIAAHLPFSARDTLRWLVAVLRNRQTLRRAGEVARKHYDLGNDFFQSFLDPLLQYSCAYFDGTDDLAEAQRKKLNLIARKLRLTKNDHLLDIGCGWGGLAKYVAETIGCRVTGINISKEQIAFARAWTAGLSVDIHELDYRKLEGTYDTIVSVGMFEHVGRKNHQIFLEKAYVSLKEGGLFLLHTIGRNNSSAASDAWINRYIFPNGQLPSAAHIMSAAEGLFTLEDWHNFGAYYDKTLMAWHRKFEEVWPRFRETFGERFCRMWRYYLLSCAGAFRARELQLWQIVLSKHPSTGYVPVR